MNSGRSATCLAIQGCKDLGKFGANMGKLVDSVARFILFPSVFYGRFQILRSSIVIICAGPATLELSHQQLLQRPGLRCITGSPSCIESHCSRLQLSNLHIMKELQCVLPMLGTALDGFIVTDNVWDQWPGLHCRHCRHCRQKDNGQPPLLTVK